MKKGSMMTRQQKNSNAVKGSGKTAGTSRSHKPFESFDKAVKYAVRSLKTTKYMKFYVYRLDGTFYPSWATSMTPHGATKVAGYSRSDPGGEWTQSYYF
jgi:hypothetical protein